MQSDYSNVQLDDKSNVNIHKFKNSKNKKRWDMEVDKNMKSPNNMFSLFSKTDIYTNKFYRSNYTPQSFKILNQKNLINNDNFEKSGLVNRISENYLLM